MGNAGRVLMIPKGDYNAATTYEMLDCVYYNGRSYVCKQTSTGNAPTNTTYWQVMTPDSSAEIQALTNYVDTEVVGARNYLDITLDSIKSANTDGTWNGNTYTLSGVTVTVSADAGGRVDNIALVGLASTTFFFTVLSKTNLLTLPFATILNGGFTATSGANALRALSEDGTTAYSDLGSGVEIPANFPMWVQIRLSQGTQAAFNVKPMIRKATDTNAEYVKYPDTLQALTQDVAGLTAKSFTKITDSEYANEILFAKSGTSKIVQVSAPKGIAANTNVEIAIPSDYTSEVAIPTGNLASFTSDFVISGGKIRMSINNAGNLVLRSSIAITSAIDEVLYMPYV